jgi:hypothetical protein
MTEGVNSWRQAGHIYIWRYAKPGKSRQGWHFTADPAGSDSLIDLVERMKVAGMPAHRTLSLGTVTPDIWNVPNFGPPKADRFAKLRISYVPEAPDLRLVASEGRLELNLGAARAVYLTAAFAEVAVGLGDFGIATSNDKHAETWMFWWMLAPPRN